jgi:hypothetical protein
LEYAIKYFEKSQLTDLISSNVSTDKIFTLSTINNLSISMMQGKYSIHYMISDDNRLNDLLSYIYSGINSYFGQDSLFYNSNDFEKDINLIFNAIKELKTASSDETELKSKFLIYGLENLLCGIIEKTLRNIFYELTKEEKYTNISTINLGYLLGTIEVIDIIGLYNSHCLEYYLLNRNGVGQNNRNDFAHFNDNIYDKLIYDTILEELYLLLTLSNILLVKGQK